MTDVYNDRSKALAYAVEMEKEGHDFYQRTALRTSHGLTKAVFEFLADEEQRHLQVITEFYHGSLAGAPTDFDKVVNAETMAETKKAIQKLFTAFEKQVPVDKPDLEAYRFARDLEKKSHDYYAAAARQSTDEQARKLFSFLVEEEDRHYRMIDDSMSYLENPQEWFHRIEKWHVEG